MAESDVYCNVVINLYQADICPNFSLGELGTFALYNLPYSMVGNLFI